ncbi:hypothetical protein ACLMJK_005218 [Lecanora helva]
MPSRSLTYIKRKRAVRDATKPTAVDKITSRHYINPQALSPLFNLIPAEIRQEIFQFALQSCPNPSKPYSRHSFWYRPGFTHAKAITIGLLLTCRRIYLESNHLPLTQNEHVIWGVENSRMPPYTSNYLLDGSMKIAQRNEIQSVHIFAQQFWLEDWKHKWLSYAQNWPNGCPPRLKITIRHTDWWYNLLGERSPLALDPKRKGRANAKNWAAEEDSFEAGSWGSRFTNMGGLEHFELELETIESKRPELDAVVDRAHTWRFPLGDGRTLILDECATTRESWSGSRHFKGLNAPNVPAGLQLRQGSIASFSGVSKKRTNSEPEILRLEDMLHYYVVTLTWSARDTSRENRARIYENSRGSFGTSSPDKPTSTIPSLTIPATMPHASYNRLNAIPTAYG